MYEQSCPPLWFNVISHGRTTAYGVLRREGIAAFSVWLLLGVGVDACIAGSCIDSRRIRIALLTTVERAIHYPHEQHIEGRQVRGVYPCFDG